MEDSDFFDLIYSMWAKTTGAEDHYWMYEEDTTWTHHPNGNPFDICAVPQDGERELVASHLTDEDADFITAVHGCFPDLIRKARGAIDEAERLDTERDEQEGRIFELEQQVDDLNARLLSYGERIKQLEDDERERESFIEGLMNENLDLEKLVDLDRWESNGGA